jgi:hypothetical protein
MSRKRPRSTTRGFSDSETDEYIRDFLSAAVVPVRAQQADNTNGVMARFKGLKCVEKMPLYKDLVAAMVERNACERLYNKTEAKLKSLDGKVQSKLDKILEAKKKSKARKIPGKT